MLSSSHRIASHRCFPLLCCAPALCGHALPRPPSSVRWRPWPSSLPTSLRLLRPLPPPAPPGHPQSLRMAYTRVRAKLGSATRKAVCPSFLFPPPPHAARSHPCGENGEYFEDFDSVSKSTWNAGGQQGRASTPERFFERGGTSDCSAGGAERGALSPAVRKS